MNEQNKTIASTRLCLSLLFYLTYRFHSFAAVAKNHDIVAISLYTSTFLPRLKKNAFVCFFLMFALLKMLHFFQPVCSCNTSGIARHFSKFHHQVVGNRNVVKKDVMHSGFKTYYAVI